MTSKGSENAANGLSRYYKDELLIQGFQAQTADFFDAFASNCAGH